MTNDIIKITGNYDYNLLLIPIPLYIHLNYLLLWLKGSLQSAQWLFQPSILLEIKGHNQKEIYWYETAATSHANDTDRLPPYTSKWYRQATSLHQQM